MELYEWCGISIQANADLKDQLSSLKSKYSEQQDTINKLNAQLEELIAAKASHETELLAKFCNLLNGKKAKIRDQQRLLASAKVDPKKVAEVQESRKGTKTRAAGPSRPGKRKAGGKSGPPFDGDEDEDGTDEGFEKMDVDVDQVPNDSDQESVQTPEPDDEETVDDDNGDEDDDAAPPVKPPARSTRQATAGRGKTTATDSKTSKVTNSKATKPNTEEDPEKTPPRRELPFAKKKAPPAKPPVDAADDETASEDDEL